MYYISFLVALRESKTGLFPLSLKVFTAYYHWDRVKKVTAKR